MGQAQSGVIFKSKKYSLMVVEEKVRKIQNVHRTPYASCLKMEKLVRKNEGNPQEQSVAHVDSKETDHQRQESESATNLLAALSQSLTDT